MGEKNGAGEKGSPAFGRTLDDPHMRLMRAYAAQASYLRPRAAELGIGQGQPKVLVFVADRGPVSQREIADFFEVDPAAVSRALDALERAGLVACAPGRDRRSKAVTATEQGRVTAEAWELVCDAEREVMLRGFSPSERRDFMDYLARVRANLRGGEKNAVAPEAPTDPTAPTAPAAPTAPEGGER